MGENLIADLFNRAILDSIVGFLALVLIDTMFALFGGSDLVFWLLNSQFASYASWILLIASFVLGNFVDKIAFLTLDHTIFREAFQSRHSSFDIPEWCQNAVEKNVSNLLVVKPNKQRDLVDDSRSDWITAYFLTKARPEAVQKRDDLVANFQFTSNMLIIVVIALFVAPTYLQFRMAESYYAIIAAVVLCAVALSYWRFSLAALARIHTFENIVVYGILIDEKEQESKQLHTAQPPMLSRIPETGYPLPS